MRLINDYCDITICSFRIHTGFANGAYFGVHAYDTTEKGLTIYIQEDSGYFAPTKPDLLSLGSSYLKWKQVYAVNGAISTSDKREKSDISYIGQESDYDTNMTDEQLTKLIMGILPVVFKRINGESGRPHHGIIAQDFEELIKKIGLVDHAAFIKSPKTRDVEIEKEIKKEDGTTETIKEVQQEEIPNEYIYGIRYEELISDVIRFCQLLKKENTKQQEEMEGLKKRLAELETIIKGA